MEADKRREFELEAYHWFKSHKENTDALYLIDQNWIQSWIMYLRGAGRDGEVPQSPDYIQNERLYRAIFQENLTSEKLTQKLKMGDDFILVHKSLFEYLYGVYGCDYFILAKQNNKKRGASTTPTRENSTLSRTDGGRSDTNISKEKP